MNRTVGAHPTGGLFLAAWPSGGAALFSRPARVRRGTGPDAAPHRGAVLPAQAAARHRQRPASSSTTRSRRPSATITHLTGRVLEPSGEPINNARRRDLAVRRQGRLHRQGGSGRTDTNFQGFGRFTTGTKGEYCFRTIKPVPYTGRTPHIHVKVKKGGKELLTTQLFINGHPQNKSDGVLGGIRDPLDRELVLVDFKPVKDSKIGELSARFDIVVGLTPAERRRGPAEVNRSAQPDIPCRPILIGETVVMRRS